MKKIKDFKIKLIGIGERAKVEKEFLDSHMQKLAGWYLTSTERSSAFILECIGVPTHDYYIVSSLGSQGSPPLLERVGRASYERSKLPELNLYEFLQYQGEPEEDKNSDVLFIEYYEIMFQTINGAPFINRDPFLIEALKRLHRDTRNEEFQTQEEAEKKAIELLTKTDKAVRRQIKFKVFKVGRVK